jgi:NADP-dependent 3-hydroxy acid dehydrogenase YdfG
VILITGASSGIGEACARAFARERRDLLLVARRGDRLAALVDELRSAHGIQAHARELDVRDRAAVEGFARENAGLLAQVTLLLNNAGLAKGAAPLDRGNPDDWDAMIDTNVKGLLYVTHAVLPHFRARGAGHVVNLGSVAGRWVYPNGNVYCATKYAVRALTEGLRLDLSGSGIRVSEISPGMVESEFSRVRFGDAEKAKAVYAGMTPLRPEDVADAVLWCASRPAHVNVQDIVIYPTDQASPTTVARRT